MAKRRQLKDAIADPMVEAREPLQRAPDENSSQSLQKILLSVVSLIVGTVAGVLLNRYLKFL